MKKVIVYHVGARDKYLVAKFFYKKNVLDCLITDYWQDAWTNLLPLRFKSKIRRRFDIELNHSKIYRYSFFNFMLGRALNSKGNVFRKWIVNDKLFTTFVLRKVKSRNPLLIWGYTNANLEVLKYYQDTKTIKIHNQIDPGIIYYDIRQKLWEENPDYENQPTPLLKEFKERILAEWEYADVIVVNSEYSKRSIVSYGANADKIHVIPLIFEKKIHIKSVNINRRLNVGFVGNINLIKGFKLFEESAKELYTIMNFYAIGSIYLKGKIVETSKSYISYLGQIDKFALEKKYEELDVLVFPTYCDGFGMVQLEAMSYGIPVLSTTNCGEVVIDGYNGYLINCTKDIIEKLSYLNENRNVLEMMSSNSLKSIEEFTFDKFESKITLMLKLLNVELF